MGIANGSIVRAVLQNAFGKSRNAATVGAGGHVFCAVQFVPVNGIQIGRHIGFVGIDLRTVFAKDNTAVVLTGNSAGVMLTAHIAVDGAVGNFTGAFVDAGNPTDTGGCRYISAKGTLQNFSAVGADNSADTGGSAAGIHSSGDFQILNNATGLQIPKQTHIGALFFDVQPADGMTVAIKRSAECRHDTGFFQMQIRFQNYGFSLRPGIQRTFFCEIIPIIYIGNSNGFFRRECGQREKPQNQTCAQQECGNLFQKCFTFHRAFPRFLL